MTGKTPAHRRFAGWLLAGVAIVVLFGALSPASAERGPAPARPASPDSVFRLAAGGWHTCALLKDGCVKCWGDNSDGQLGDGTRYQRSTVVDVAALAGVTAVAAGGLHTCALTSAGGVKCWGEGWDGQLGRGWCGAASSASPVDVVGLPDDVVAITAGFLHTCALTGSGRVKCWGQNLVGQLGDGTRVGACGPRDVAGLTGGVIAVAAGGYHTCAVMSAGGLKCWGENEWGQLGDGTTTDRYTPTDVWGLDAPIAAIAAGFHSTCALTTAGAVKCWGYGGSVIPEEVSGLSSGVTAVAVGTGHKCVQLAGGVKCWGNNAHGQVGDGTTELRTSPVDVTGLASGVAALSAGYGYTCAATGAGRVRCWGMNEEGQLGDGTTEDRTTPVAVRFGPLFYLPLVAQ